MLATLKDLASRLEQLTGWRRAVWAMAAGVVATLAMPPVYAIPLLWISFPILVCLLDGSKRNRDAFAVGWWFGFGHFSSGIYWIANALLIDASRFAWMIPFAVFGLGGFLALYVGGATWAAWRCTRSGLLRILALTVSWIVMEWARGWVFTGFPWNPLGSVWVAVTPILQFAALAGIFGLSALTVLTASMPALLGRDDRRAKGAFIASLCLLAVIFGWGYWRIPAGPQPAVPGLKFRLVQAAIPQTLKWMPSMRANNLALHVRLSQGPGFEQITHVIWPETAAPSFLAEDDESRMKVAAIVPAGGLLLTGVVRGEPPDDAKIYNSLQAINGAGDIIATYDKAHLVPFGEYVPSWKYLPLKKVTPGDRGYSAGPGPITLALPGLPPVSVMICYEAIFPFGAVSPAPRPAWLLNVTNDGWYGFSAEPYQHLAAARIRAVEQGLPLVRATNTGISAVIDPYGRIIHRLPLGTSGVIDSELPLPLSDSPLYARLMATLLLQL